MNQRPARTSRARLHVPSRNVSRLRRAITTVRRDMNLKTKPEKTIACGETVYPTVSPSRNGRGSNFPIPSFNRTSSVRASALRLFRYLFVNIAARVYRVAPYCTREIKIAMYYSDRGGFGAGMPRMHPSSASNAEAGRPIRAGNHSDLWPV